jgi:hypothetical protein
VRRRPADSRRQVNAHRPTSSALAKQAFLAEFRLHGIVAPAARAAGIARQTVYEWQEHDPEFAVALNLAREEAIDALEHEAHRRAVFGVKQERPIYYRGELVGTQEVTEYSDRLLELALKAGRPDKYRERYDVTTAGQPLIKEVDAPLSAVL